MTLTVDYLVYERDAMREYGVKFTKIEDVKDVDCVKIAVAYNELSEIEFKDIKKLYRDGSDSEKVLNDFKRFYRV